VPITPEKGEVKDVKADSEFDFKDKNKSYWKKFSSKKLDEALNELNVDKEVTIVVKGEYVKKPITKINKEEKLKLLHEKLDI
jgi:hypothetical protein